MMMLRWLRRNLLARRGSNQSFERKRNICGSQQQRNEETEKVIQPEVDPTSAAAIRGIKSILEYMEKKKGETSPMNQYKACRGINTILRSFNVKKYREEPDRQTDLRNGTSSNNTTSRDDEFSLEDEILQAVLGAMLRHPFHSGVQQAGCELMGILATFGGCSAVSTTTSSSTAGDGGRSRSNSAEMVESIVDWGGVVLLEAALYHGTDSSSDVVHAAMQAIYAILSVNGKTLSTTTTTTTTPTTATATAVDCRESGLIVPPNHEQHFLCDGNLYSSSPLVSTPSPDASDAASHTRTIALSEELESDLIETDLLNTILIAVQHYRVHDRDEGQTTRGRHKKICQLGRNIINLILSLDGGINDIDDNDYNNPFDDDAESPSMSSSAPLTFSSSPEYVSMISSTVLISPSSPSLRASGRRQEQQQDEIDHRHSQQQQEQEHQQLQRSRRRLIPKELLPRLRTLLQSMDDNADVDDDDDEYEYEHLHSRRFWKRTTILVESAALAEGSN